MPTQTKKFNTELTDYSTHHTEYSGPYAVDLDIDAIIVGAGFGMTIFECPRPPSRI